MPDKGHGSTGGNSRQGRLLAHWQVASHSVLRAQLSAGARLPCVRVTCHCGKSPWQVIPPIVTPNLALLNQARWQHPASRSCRPLDVAVGNFHPLGRLQSRWAFGSSRLREFSLTGSCPPCFRTSRCRCFQEQGLTSVWSWISSGGRWGTNPERESGTPIRHLCQGRASAQ